MGTQVLAAVGVVLALVAGQVAAGADAGGLIGMGVRSCDGLRDAELSAGRGDDHGVLDLRRFEDWSAGFVSGLSLAAGRDLLRNVPFDGFMRRVAQHCGDYPSADLFTAVNAVLRQINTPEQD